MAERWSTTACNQTDQTSSTDTSKSDQETNSLSGTHAFYNYQPGEAEDILHICVRFTHAVNVSGLAVGHDSEIFNFPNANTANVPTMKGTLPPVIFTNQAPAPAPVIITPSPTISINKQNNNQNNQ